jgi:hypothetical protein
MTEEGAVPTEFSVVLEDRPGALAGLCDVLGDAAVNIQAIQGVSHAGWSIVQFVPRDAGRAAAALAAAAIPCTTREVLIVRVLDEPGTLGQVAFVMSRAGINIDSVYVTTDGDIVLGVDDLPGAIQVAGGLAVMRFE